MVDFVQSTTFVGGRPGYQADIRDDERTSKVGEREGVAEFPLVGQRGIRGGPQRKPDL